MSDELIKRLREGADKNSCMPIGELWNLLDEAADEIEKLRCLLRKLTASNVTYWDDLGEVRHDVGTTKAEAMMVFREARKILKTT